MDGGGVKGVCSVCVQGRLDVFARFRLKLRDCEPCRRTPRRVRVGGETQEQRMGEKGT